MKYSSVFASIIILVSMSNLQAQTPKFVNEFLNIGVGARSHGMGGAMAAHVSDNTAAYWNSGGLAFQESGFQIAAMHAEWFGGIVNYDYLSIGKSLNSNGTESYGAFSLIRLGVDQIQNTLRLYAPDGTIDYNRIERFSVSDYAALLSYARRLKDDRFGIGGNVKIIHRSAGKFANAWGFGLDLGATFRMDNWSFGIMTRDITTTYNSWNFSFSEEEKAILQQTNNQVPESSTEIALPQIILGASWFKNLNENFSLLVATDFHFTTDGRRNTLVSNSTFSMDPRVGLEAGYKDLVFLRAGVYNFQKVLEEINGDKDIWKVQPNVGIGLKIGSVRIDYALGNPGQVSEVEVSHLFSLALNINPLRSEEK